MPETTGQTIGSRGRAIAALVILVGCGGTAEPGAPAKPPERAPAAAAPPAPPPPAPGEPTMSHDEPAGAETCLGVDDHGIWSDLDERIQLALPAGVTADRATAVVAEDLLVLYVDGWPTKPYPLAGDATLTIGDHALALRAGDAEELRPLLRPGAVRRLAAGEAPPPGDRDGDAIPDPLDVLIGAKKTAAQAGEYGGDYIRIEYPMGDVPRTTGKCTDVVIRALRNAGLDLQAEVQADIRKSPNSYPMVKRRDPNIDHRRVKTILPWFRRHADERTAALDDPADPLRPGDVVFMDTFPSRSGPDHVGIVSDTLGEDGMPLVINAWTDGFVTQEMDLLGWVPVTHRFRL